MSTLTSMDVVNDQVEDGAPPPFVRPEAKSGKTVAQQIVEGDFLDLLFDKVDAGELRLTGEGGFIPEMIKAVLERGLQVELGEHLGYDKGDPAGRGSPNMRNGSTSKTIQSELGPLGLAIPRDRAGSFEPRLVPKGSRRVGGGLDEMILSLYAGGMTARDIESHLARTLGVEVSRETISKITDGILEEVKAWQTRPLDPFYPIVYVDALVVKVKDGPHVVNKAAHIVVGVDLDGIKHVLGIWVQTHEGANFWAGVMAELANRGVKDVLIACCDGLVGLPEAIEATFPRTVVQTYKRSIHTPVGDMQVRIEGRRWNDDLVPNCSRVSIVNVDELAIHAQASNTTVSDVVGRVSATSNNRPSSDFVWSLWRHAHQDKRFVGSRWRIRWPHFFEIECFHCC